MNLAFIDIDLIQKSTRFTTKKHEEKNMINIVSTTILKSSAHIDSRIGIDFSTTFPFGTGDFHINTGSAQLQISI